MGLDKVKDEVISKARQDADSVTRQAKKEADRIVLEAEEQAKKAKVKADEDIKKACESIQMKHLASAELEARKAVLEEKKIAIDRVFELAKKKIAEMPEKQRQEYITRLLEKASKEIEASYIYCNSRDRKLITGPETKDAAIIGGIIAETGKGDVRIDYSYDSILETIKEKHLQELGTLLFG